MIYTTERGLSKSRNLAIANAKTDICLICDDDEIFVDNYEEIILNAYYENKNVLTEEAIIQFEKDIKEGKNINVSTYLKEEKDKQLLALEYVIGFIAVITFLILIFIASYIEMQPWIRILLIVSGSIIFAVGVGNAIKIEQIAGYYECPKCNHKYIPTYQSVFWAQHLGRTRKMKCPKCGKKSWNKKVLSGGNEND